MNIFKNYRIYLILAWMLFNGFSCQECEETLRDTASFSIRVDSGQTVLELGDTLFFGSSFSSQIELDNSGMIYDQSDGYYRYKVEVFRVRAGYIEAVPARDRFKYISLSGHADTSTSSTEWDLPLAGYCDSLVCDLRVGMIPEYTGYYGIVVRDGYFGKGRGGVYCESLRFRNLKIESNGGNNFADLEPELGWGRVRINEREYEHPETEETLYFFKVE